MKAGDFTPCAICGKGVAHTGVPLFYRVRIERMGIDHRAVQHASGMEQYFGGAVAIARVFADPEIASRIGDETTILVCESCSVESHPLAMLAERGKGSGT